MIRFLLPRKNINVCKIYFNFFIYSALPIVVTTGGSVGSGGKVVSTAGVVGVGIGGRVVDVVDAKIL